MVRDFSGEAKQELLQYVDSIISKQRWEEIANTIVFYNVSIPVIVSRLGIKECIDSVGNYYSNLINKNKATKRQIEEIFANVQMFERGYIDSSLKQKLKSVNRKLIISDWCIGCGKCAQRCQYKAISLIEGKAVVDHEKCILCTYCAKECADFCIKVI